MLQRLRKKEEDVYKVAERYYSLISSLNDFFLTQREIQLMAHAAINGNISYAHIKEEFCIKHNTSVQTIYNMVSKLKRLKVFINDNGKIKVHPALCLKFDEPLSLEILISNG